MTGRDNLHFVARIYGQNVRKVSDFVDDFSELGDYLDAPVKTYSSGMMARLAFGLSMAIEFDCYLIDEVTAVGDARFQRRCAEAFTRRRKCGFDCRLPLNRTRSNPIATGAGFWSMDD